MSKRVRITLEMDTEFIHMLDVACGLGKLGLYNKCAEDSGESLAAHAPVGALAGLVLAEARGATEDQVHAAIPLEWRAHIWAVSEERKVTET